MNLKHLFLSSFFVLLCISFIHGQSVETNGRITNSFYSYEDKDTHARLYQLVRFRALSKEYHNLGFNFVGRTLTDLNQSITFHKRFNIYRFSLSSKGLFNKLMDVELGRQFLHAGIPFGSLDGAKVMFHPSPNLNIQVYAGIESKIDRSFRINYFNRSPVYGTSIKYSNFHKTDIQFAYLQKYYEENNRWQIAGLNLTNYLLKNISFRMQSHYDLINSRFHRLYLSGRYSPDNQWNVELFVKQQYPQIYGDSFFKTFKVCEYQQAGINGGYLLTDEYLLDGSYQFVKIKDGEGHRFVAAVNNSNGSFSIVYETGDLGEQLGFLLDYAYEIIPDLIASLSIDYTRYRFEEIYDFQNQLANAVRLSYKISSHWRVDGEYQWLNNKFKNYDHRFLNHIHYIW